MIIHRQVSKRKSPIASYDRISSNNMEYESSISSSSSSKTWISATGVECTDSKCFKTPSGVQKTTTITREHLVEAQGARIESEQSCSSLGPSTSFGSRLKLPPLEQFTLMIGKKVLRFKVIDAEEAPDDPEFQKEHSETTWMASPQPVTEPKPLAGLFRCPHCKTYFGKENVWRRHMTNFHTDPRLFRCVHCGMQFTTKSNLNTHLKEHAIQRQYLCTHCPKVFSRPEARDNHQRIHAIRHCCDTCGRFFRLFEQFEAHKALCSGSDVSQQKPLRFRCSYCDRLFFQKRDMITHERIHTGERPFTCGYCNKAFTQSQTLTIHIRSHTGEKPYVCTQGSCKMAYKDNSSLRKHELLQHRRPNRLLYHSIEQPAPQIAKPEPVQELNMNIDPLHEEIVETNEVDLELDATTVYI